MSRPESPVGAVRRRAFAQALAVLAAACFVPARAQTPLPGVVPGPAPVPRAAAPAELAVRTLPAFPWVESVRAFFEGQNVSVALDTSVRPWTIGLTANVWVVAHRSAAQWDANPFLVDVRGVPQSVTFVAGSVQANTFVLSNALSGDAGLGLGVGYDVVIDANGDGRLDEPDLVDGYGDEAGFYVCKPTALPGPLAVTEVLYSGGTWLGEDIYYPTNVASLGALPLVVVSHGNGHNYTWYDHIGTHLASWGCVVMSHTNNTMPGPDSAALTTLQNTDHFLANLGTIAGGVLNGHVDSHRIVWVGHSRGAEGVARAVDRLFDGTNSFPTFTLADIVLVSSIAPTDFLGTSSANAHAKNMSLWVGGADADVDGCVASDIAVSWPLLWRATGVRQSIELHGAGHGAFHDGGGSTVSSGPCLLTRLDVHPIMKAYLLPLVKRYTEGNLPALDFLTRPWETFSSPGVPANSCIVVDLQYSDTAASGKRVVDDFETNTGTTVSSSGGAVIQTFATYSETRLDDTDTAFTFSTTAPANGMCDAIATDNQRGAVMAWSASDRGVNFEVPLAWRDLRDFRYLSLRACQCTRATETIAALGDLDFTIVLQDTLGHECGIRASAYGSGIEEPYQRTGCGTGTGWNNEWETIRVRLTDFTRDGTLVDLGKVAAVELRFGPSWGASNGRIGLDDLEFLRE